MRLVLLIFLFLALGCVSEPPQSSWTPPPPTYVAAAAVCDEIGHGAIEHKAERGRSPICHSGFELIWLKPARVQEHIDHGDTLGLCKEGK